MRRNAHALRRLAGIGMLIVGLAPFITGIITINEILLSALIFVAAGAAMLGQSGRPLLGIIVFAFWLFASGIIIVLNQMGTFDFPLLNTVLAIMALLAGVLMIIDR